MTLMGKNNYYNKYHKRYKIQKKLWIKFDKEIKTSML